MIDWKKFNPFTKPSADELAVRELDEARRSLLEAQSYKEYYMAIEAFNVKRIDRLEKRMKGLS